MNAIKKGICLSCLLLGLSVMGNAQIAPDSMATSQKAKTIPPPKDSLQAEKALAESLSKAAEAASRAADKIKIIVETKADKLAQKSQPYIETLAATTASLIEKLARELNKITTDSTSKKP